MFSFLWACLATWMNRNDKHDFILIKSSSDLRLEHSCSDLLWAKIVKHSLLVKAPEGSKVKGNWDINVSWIWKNLAEVIVNYSFFYSKKQRISWSHAWSHIWILNNIKQCTSFWYLSDITYYSPYNSPLYTHFSRLTIDVNCYEIRLYY